MPRSNPFQKKRTTTRSLAPGKLSGDQKRAQAQGVRDSARRLGVNNASSRSQPTHVMFNGEKVRASTVAPSARNITPQLEAARIAQRSQPLISAANGRVNSTIAAGNPGTVQAEKSRERDLLAKAFSDKASQRKDFETKARQSLGLEGVDKTVRQRFGGGPSRGTNEFTFKESGNAELDALRSEASRIRTLRTPSRGTTREVQALESRIKQKEDELFRNSDAFAQLQEDLATFDANNLDDDIRTGASRQARNEAKAVSSNLSIMKTAQGDVELDRDRIERLANGTSLASDRNLDRIQNESDEDFAVRKFNAQKENQRQDLNHRFNSQSSQIKESFASFADPNTGKINPNAARRMAKSLRKVSEERERAMSRLEQTSDFQLESFIRNIKDEKDKSPLQLDKEKAELEISQLANQLVENLGIPMRMAIGKATDMLSYKQAKDPTQQDKIDALNDIEVGTGIDRAGAAGIVFNKLQDLGDSEDYMRNVLGMGEIEIEDQIDELRLAKNPHLTKEDLQREKASESFAAQQTSFINGDMEGLSVGNFLFNAEASKSPESYKKMLDVAIATGNYKGTMEGQIIQRARQAVGGIGSQNLTSNEIAEGIFDGVGDLNDVLTKERTPVLKRLRELSNEALAEGNLAGVLRASAVHGDKAPSDTFLGSFAKGRNVIDQVGELQRLMLSDGYVDEEGNEIDLSPLSGWLREKNPWDRDAQEIKAILQQTIPNLARGVFGEVGVLTDRDVELYRKTLPNLKSTKAVQQAVLGITVRAVQRALENQIETQANGRRNMSGFVSSYEDIVRKTDEIMGIRALPQPAVELFNKSSREDQIKLIESAKFQFFDVSQIRDGIKAAEKESQEKTAGKEIQGNADTGITEVGIDSVLPGQKVKLSAQTKTKVLSARDHLLGQGIKLQIADSFRPTSVQKESFESGKEGVAPPGTSFHEKGDAIDLAQFPEMNNEKVFAALREAGLQQHPGEWWHWSSGEFNNQDA
tara:strand:- start:7386 stop:10340 length:2955 start_codon:yes stop_codon:yes gene_type:complete